MELCCHYLVLCQILLSLLSLVWSQTRRKVFPSGWGEYRIPTLVPRRGPRWTLWIHAFTHKKNSKQRILLLLDAYLEVLDYPACRNATTILYNRLLITTVQAQISTTGRVQIEHTTARDTWKAENRLKYRFFNVTFKSTDLVITLFVKNASKIR